MALTFLKQGKLVIYRENKEKVSEIFGFVMVIKFFLFLLFVGVMSAIYLYLKSLGGFGRYII
jgi:hypothetical protein